MVETILLEYLALSEFLMSVSLEIIIIALERTSLSAEFRHVDALFFLMTFSEGIPKKQFY